jgi:hypothetical protein
VRNTDTQRIRTATKFVRSSAGHSESALRSSVTKTAQLIVLQPSRSALTMPGETLALSIATEKCTVVCWQHSVTCRRPPSLPCMVGFCAFRIVFTFGGTQFSSFSRDFFLKSHGSEMQSVQFVFPMVVILGLRNEFCSE